MSRVLALDLGTHRIGIAISDPDRILTSPLPALQRTQLARDLQALVKLMQDHHAATVVVGMPLQMNGVKGRKARETETFMAVLEQALRAANVAARVCSWDERMSSVAAQRVLISGGMSRQKRRDKVDSMAAQLILQGFLDATPTP